MLFISPPFGNYIDLNNTISIRGSFTLNERKGKWSQILKTLRYVPAFGGWVNKIGLRNPGIDYAINTYKKGEIISIAILNKNEIPKLVEKIPEDMDIELNVSCPNLDKKTVSDGLSKFINKKREWCIIKLSPIDNGYDVSSYYKDGFRQFHASNTIPCDRGGISGPMIKPYTAKLIKYIKSSHPNAVVIAGGGIKNKKDIEYYRKLGADHFSISSVWFTPITAINLYYDWCCFE